MVATPTAVRLGMGEELWPPAGLGPVGGGRAIARLMGVILVNDNLSLGDISATEIVRES